jgi:glycosyltransferase involved in cell wall biosynthesis
MISICILNWNCLITLKKTIKIIQDDLKNIIHEIIIYDQNSNDGSVDYLEKIQSNNIFIILDKQNSGNSIARNKMIHKSKYQYILLLDSDIIPIKNSIPCMVNFMQDNPRYSYLGYDWRSYTDDEQKITVYENKIFQSDIVDWKDNIALTQYGIFRTEVLREFPFPEFYPFNLPGWGGEDDIIGSTIKESNIGIGGTIKKRIYFHNKSSSITYLGHDTYQRLYMTRFIYTKYFIDFLNLEKKINSLKQKKIEKTLLHCQKYYWKKDNNLGDIVTHNIFIEYFPFFEFNDMEKNNLFMFGGTIFNHIDNANKLYNTKFKNILYFGVGLSNEYELNQTIKYIKNNNISYIIIPRGQKTRELFLKKSIECRKPCGDVLQLLSSLPLSKTNIEDPELLVYDIYHPNLIIPKSNNYEIIKIANNNFFENIKFYDFSSFLRKINHYSKIYSSQVHPFFISCLLGKPATLYQKDFRADDLAYFKSFKLDMFMEDSLMLRSEAQKNIQSFITRFFKQMKKFT